MEPGHQLTIYYSSTSPKAFQKDDVQVWWKLPDNKITFKDCTSDQNAKINQGYS